MLLFGLHRITRIPNQLAILTQPSATANVGVVFAQQPVIQVKDAFGNFCNPTNVTAARNGGSGKITGYADLWDPATGHREHSKTRVIATVGGEGLCLFDTKFEVRHRWKSRAPAAADNPWCRKRRREGSFTPAWSTESGCMLKLMFSPFLMKYPSP